MTNREKLSLALAVFLTSLAVYSTGLWMGVMKGRGEVRAEVALAADHCAYMLELGLKDWQEAVGTPLTKQITCRPLDNIAAGKEWIDWEEDG